VGGVVLVLVRVCDVWERLYSFLWLYVLVYGSFCTGSIDDVY
jgi:hypothetical protein